MSPDQRAPDALRRSCGSAVGPKLERGGVPTGAERTRAEGRFVVCEASDSDWRLTVRFHSDRLHAACWRACLSGRRPRLQRAGSNRSSAPGVKDHGCASTRRRMPRCRELRWHFLHAQGMESERRGASRALDQSSGEWATVDAPLVSENGAELITSNRATVRGAQTPRRTA
jgi:hypothetical protein